MSQWYAKMWSRFLFIPGLFLLTQTYNAIYLCMALACALEFLPAKNSLSKA